MSPKGERTRVVWMGGVRQHREVQQEGAKNDLPVLKTQHYDKKIDFTSTFCCTPKRIGLNHGYKIEIRCKIIDLVLIL